MTTPSGISRIPIPRKSRGRLTYIRPEAESTCPQLRRRARRSGATGRQVVRRDAEPREPDDHGEDEQRQTRVAQELDQAARARLDRLAEEVGRAGAEHAARRHGVGPRPPALRPGDRLGPLLLQVRAGRAVEERVLELAPAALVGDPRERGARRRRVARDRDHLRARAAGAGRACRRSRRPARRSCRRRARGRRSSRASRRPGRRPGRGRRRARASRRPSPPPRRPRAGCSRRRPAPRRAPPRRRRRRRRAGSSPSRPRAGCSSRCRGRRASTAAPASRGAPGRLRRGRRRPARGPRVRRRSQRS